MLKLFRPWRKETDLELPDNTYSETFATVCDSLPDIVSYHEKNVNLAEEQKRMEEFVKARAAKLKEDGGVNERVVNRHDDECVMEDVNGFLEGCGIDAVEMAMIEIEEAQKRKSKKCQETRAEELYLSLNTDQLRVVNTVMSHIQKNDGDAIRLIVSGEGGTGKSRVIEVLDKLVTQRFSTANMSTVPVVVCAPTGLAAFNVNGCTIHKILSLPVEHGKPADYYPLNQDQLILMRSTLRGLKLMIIDEISMVSSVTLLFIHLRLTEIMALDDPFGGINMVVFGDFLQLPPVKGNQPFIPATFFETKQRIGSVGTLNIWQQFHYDKLTINMRQGSDKDYAELIQNVRLGQLTESHHTMLNKRLIKPGRRATTLEVAETYNNLVASGSSPIIFGTNHCNLQRHKHSNYVTARLRATRNKGC